MDIFDWLSMLGGLALFLYGMHLMGDGLSKASGGRLERILEKLTSSPIKAVLVGTGVTAVIQSSSATTVMVVGFVNSGIMKLGQAVGVIMGANIGTTVTSWLLSLTGIDSSSIWVNMLKPSSFSPILATIGVVLIMFSKKDSHKNIAAILIGFAVLMFGMDAMSEAVTPLQTVPEFTGMLTKFTNPILGMLAGLILTAIIQSSSASVGILQALCVTGAVSYGAAIPIIMGQNIGTCVTAILSGIGASRNAKRAALVHLYFNIIGTILFMVVFYTINTLKPFAFLTETADAMGIAVIHSAFNVAATLVLLPFSKVLVKLACFTIREEDKPLMLSEQEKAFLLLDTRFLDTPGLAVEQSRKVAEIMSQLVQESMVLATELLDEYTEEKAVRVVELEDEVDKFEDALGSYLVRLSTHELSTADSHVVNNLLHSISDLERISDHARNIKESAEEMHEKKLHFSEKADLELGTFRKAVCDILGITIQSFTESNLQLAEQVEPMEEVIDGLNLEIRQRHVKRLREGKCTMELGFVLVDVCTNLERVSDHCSNIALCLLQEDSDKQDAHAYVNDLKTGENSNFGKRVEQYRRQYQL